MKAKRNHLITAVTSLNRKEIDYLDKLGKDAYFRYGRKLPRGNILSELVELLMELDIDIKDMDLEHQTLHNAIIQGIKHGTND